jgi:NCAIR mutase (PurE)-related protein
MMDRDKIQEILQAIHDHGIGVNEAMQRLADIPFADMDFAKVDHQRALRTGYPEIIFCQNKSVEQITSIVAEQISHDETVFGTRAGGEVIDAMMKRFDRIESSRQGRCFWRKSSSWKMKDSVMGTILIASAGTSDAPAVEEARCTVDILGHPCQVLQDVGVAGIHRLFAHHGQLRKASIIIVVAGMEGALPSVVAGLVSCPVIAVPTSVGYGAHLGGLVPMFAMLNSCASGLTVVNIDNGFGAACAAVRMNGLQAHG